MFSEDIYLYFFDDFLWNVIFVQFQLGFYNVCLIILINIMLFFFYLCCFFYFQIVVDYMFKSINCYIGWFGCVYDVCVFCNFGLYNKVENGDMFL